MLESILCITLIYRYSTSLLKMSGRHANNGLEGVGNGEWGLLNYLVCFSTPCIKMFNISYAGYCVGKEFPGGSNGDFSYFNTDQPPWRPESPGLGSSVRVMAARDRKKIVCALFKDLVGN